MHSCCTKQPRTSARYFELFCCLSLCIYAPAVSRAETRSRGEQNACHVKHVALPGPGKTGFVSLRASDIGINFTNRLTDQELARNSNLMQGSGVALGDIDGDGLC